MWYWTPWYALIIQSFIRWEPKQFRNPPGLDKNVAGMKDLTLWGDTAVYKWAFTGRGTCHPTSGALLNCWGYLISDLKELSAESGTLPPTPVTDIDNWYYQYQYCYQYWYWAWCPHRASLLNTLMRWGQLLLEVVQSGGWNADTEP